MFQLRAQGQLRHASCSAAGGSRAKRGLQQRVSAKLNLLQVQRQRHSLVLGKISSQLSSHYLSHFCFFMNDSKCQPSFWMHHCMRSASCSIALLGLLPSSRSMKSCLPPNPPRGPTTAVGPASAPAVAGAGCGYWSGRRNARLGRCPARSRPPAHRARRSSRSPSGGAAPWGARDIRRGCRWRPCASAGALPRRSRQRTYQISPLARRLTWPSLPMIT